MISFESEYAKLNKEQKLAVNTISGPVLVLAGPGSGKTSILTLRIANILKQTDVSAENILALTFTESAAKNMKERLIKLIGKDAYYTNIYTFHAFAKTVITENPDYFVTQKEGNVATDLDKLLIIQKILKTGEYELLKPIGSPYYYTNTLLQKISTLKREGVSENDFEKLIENNSREILQIENKDKKTQKDLAEIKVFKKQIEFSSVYKNYQIELKKKELIDFDDMINFVVEAFEKNEELLRNYQEKFLYILVDEFQDTNNAQYKLLKLLTSYWKEESADIFAVGDDDQSIYRFQGASVENILNFTKDFANTNLIVLTQNYRSGENIVKTSREVIKNNNQAIENFIPNLNKQLVSANKTKTNVKYINFSNEILENYFIAKKIKKLIKKGEDPTEIAVIYRNNSDSSDIAEILSKKDISYNLEGGENILKNDIILQLINFFRVIDKAKNLDEDLDFFNTVSFDFLQFNALDNLKLARISANSKKTMLDTILNENFSKSGIVTYQKYIDFVTLVADFNKTNSEFQFNKTFEEIINKSNFLNWVLQQKNYIELINKINSLYSEIQSWVKTNENFKLKEFLGAIDLMNENYLKIKEMEFNITTNAVTLTTCHKAKGLEFKHIFIKGFSDKKWGNNKNADILKLPENILNTKTDEKNIKNEEERRLFYVALTRAKKNIYITNSVKEPSIFLQEIPSDLIKILKTEKIESKKFIENAIKYYVSKNSEEKISIDEKDMLKPLIENYKLSVTGLNTYQTCGYKFKLNTLLKTPRAKSPYLCFGSAVHKALENFYKKYKETSTIPDYEFLEEEFLKAIAKESFSKKDNISMWISKGKKVLQTYYENYKQDFKKPEFCERLFGFGYSKIFVGDVQIAGKVDRIEVVENKGGEKIVKIIDYKSGNPKSRNEIMDVSKVDNYKKQLVFYKILCDLDKSFRYKAEIFELDFVEPNKQNGKLKKESFTITEEEVKELKNGIVEAMKKIRNFEFERTTDYSICENCDYKMHCYPRGIPQLKMKQGMLNI